MFIVLFKILSSLFFELACQVGNQLFHDCIDLLVIQSLFCIMKKLIANLTGKLNAELR